MKRKVIIGIVLALLIILSITAYLYRDYINVYLVNREIEADGVKLLMSGDEVGNILHEKYDPKPMSSKYIFHTFNNKTYDNRYLIVDVIKVNKYKHRVIMIDTEKKDSIILGIKIGDKLADAAVELKKRGFKIQSYDEKFGDLSASRGNVRVGTDTGNANGKGWIINRITISIYPNGSEPK